MGLTDRMSTRTKSWRDEGKSVFSAVRRTVPEHGTRGGAVPAAGAGGGRGRRARPARRACGARGGGSEEARRPISSASI